MKSRYQHWTTPTHDPEGTALRRMQNAARHLDQADAMTGDQLVDFTCSICNDQLEVVKLSGVPGARLRDIRRGARIRNAERASLYHAILAKDLDL